MDGTKKQEELGVTTSEKTKCHRTPLCTYFSLLSSWLTSFFPTVNQLFQELGAILRCPFSHFHHRREKPSKALYSLVLTWKMLGKDSDVSVRYPMVIPIWNTLHLLFGLRFPNYATSINSYPKTMCGSICSYELLSSVSSPQTHYHHKKVRYSDQTTFDQGSIPWLITVAREGNSCKDMASPVPTTVNGYKRVVEPEFLRRRGCSCQRTRC